MDDILLGLAHPFALAFERRGVGESDFVLDGVLSRDEDVGEFLELMEWLAVVAPDARLTLEAYALPAGSEQVGVLYVDVGRRP